MTTHGQHAGPRRSWPLALAASVPALAVGVLAMRASGVPASVWGQNVVAWAGGALLCLGVRRVRAPVPAPILVDLVALLTLAALVATLLVPGMDGVHRWVSVGALRLHPAALLVPIQLVALERLARERGWWTACLWVAGAVSALHLQPDAAQATALAAASVALLLPGVRRSPARAIPVAAVSAIAGLTWLRRDPLAPVPHVEEIVALAGAAWTGGAVAAVASLLLLPVPFFLAAKGARRGTGLALGVYVSVACLAAFAGNFPVPVLGYGISPIIGYLLGVGAFLRPAAPGE